MLEESFKELKIRGYKMGQNEYALETYEIFAEETQPPVLLDFFYFPMDIQSQSPLHKWMSPVMHGYRLAGSLSLLISCFIFISFVNRTVN